MRILLLTLVAVAAFASSAGAGARHRNLTTPRHHPVGTAHAGHAGRHRH